MPNQLDPDAVNLAKALRQTESGGDFTAKGKSGEYGAYQFTPQTWNTYAAKHGVSVPLQQATPEQQNEVAYKQVKEWKDQGLNVGQIASLWNSGKPDAYTDPNYKGVNQFGAHYDVPAYAKSVATAYQTLKAGGQVQADPNNPSSTANTTPVEPQPQQPQHSALRQVADFLFPIAGDAYDVLKGKNSKTPEQILGDTALSALWFVPGLGAAGAAGKAALGAKAAMGVTKLGAEAAAEGTAKGVLPRLLANKTAQATLKGAGVGYGADVATKMSQGSTDYQDVLTPGIGTIAGGGLGALGGKLSGTLANLAEKNATTRLTDQTNRLKSLTNAFEANSTKTTDPIKTLTEQNLASKLKVVDGKINAEALTNNHGTGEIDNLIAQHADDASASIKKLPGAVTLPAFKQSVLEDVYKNPLIRDSGRLAQAEADVERRFASYERSFGDNVSWETVDNIRKAMNRVYNPDEIDIARTIGNTARDYLYNGSPLNSAIRTAMANETELIKARNFVDKLHGSTVPGGRLGKYIADATGTGVGTAIGGMTGGPIGAGLGALAGGAVTNKVVNRLQSNYFNPLGSKSAGALQSLLKSAPAQKVKSATNVGLLKLLSQTNQNSATGAQR